MCVYVCVSERERACVYVCVSEQAQTRQSTVGVDEAHLHAVQQFNFGTSQILSRYLRLPTPKIRVYMLVEAYDDAILRLCMWTDPGMFRDEVKTTFA